jgi:hypothetical protein
MGQGERRIQQQYSNEWQEHHLGNAPMGAIAATCSAGNEGEGAVAQATKDLGQTKDLQHKLLETTKPWKDSGADI